MDRQDHIVFVVDDDRRIREALSDLLASFDMHAVAFGSAAEYMAYAKPDVPACLVLDVELPDINGLDFQSRRSCFSPDTETFPLRCARSRQVRSTF